MSSDNNSQNKRPKTIKDYLDNTYKHLEKALRQPNSVETNTSKSFYKENLKRYNSKRELFEFFKMKEDIFDILKAYLVDIPFQHRGKKGFFDTIEDKVFLMLMYFTNGKINNSFGMLWGN